MDDASVLDISDGATPATTKDTERLPQTCLWENTGGLQAPSTFLSMQD